MGIHKFINWHNYQFCNYNLLGFESKSNQIKFNEWRLESQLKQITFITVLTAFLYYFFTFIHNFYIYNKVNELMTFWHMYVTPTILLSVSALSYTKKYRILMTAILIIAPIVAAIANIYIVSKFEAYTTYQTELYLIIFWVFMVSGLRFIHAFNTAMIIFIIAIVSSVYIYPKSSLEELLMHIFWMLASLSFGFMGAYLYQDSQKKVFLQQIELEKMVVTDRLTGLYNRKMCDDTIAKEIKKTKRSKYSFGIIIIDIDYFKNINDTYGHSIGDKVLVEMADILKNNTRLTDVLIRWGGEEFIVICMDVNKKGIESIAENIRQKVEQSNFHKTDRLTISAGATISREDDDINSIIKRADEALYRMKKDGRNKIEVI